MLLSTDKEDEEEMIDDNKSEKDETIQEVFTEDGDKTVTVHESMLSSNKEVELEGHSYTTHETLERTEATLNSNSTPVVDTFPGETNPSDEDLMLAALEENIALDNQSYLPQNETNIVKESNPVGHEEITEDAPHVEGSKDSHDLSENAEEEMSKYRELPKFTFHFFNTKRKRAPSSCGEEEANKSQRRTPFDVGKWLSHHIRKVTDV
jgi:hypothetical protein